MDSPPLSCPVALPFLCGDGQCAENSAKCLTDLISGCPVGLFKCASDGTCVSDVSKCVASVSPCSSDTTRCTDGSCRPICSNVLPNGCSSELPIRCFSQNRPCAATVNEW